MKKLGSFAVFSLVGAILIHLGVFYILGIQPPEPRQPVDQEINVLYVGNILNQPDEVIAQQSSLMDSAPLFLPTRWNLVSEMSNVASLREATEVFGPFPARLRLPESTPNPPWNNQLLESSLEWAIPEGPEFLLAKLGRESRSVSVGEGIPQQVRVVKLDGDPASGWFSVLPEDLVEAASPNGLWTPAGFVMQVAAGKPVGSPLLVESSGFPEWDEVLLSHLASLDFYRLLDSGYYRIEVFP